LAIREEARRGFQQGAAAYERGRPGYPREAIEWFWHELELGPGRTVVDVGAGTGKLTRELVGSGARVIAIEPVPGMRGVLERAVPGVQLLDGTAEAMPVGDEAVDAIVVAQAFHWFDGPAAVAEFHRALRPDGRLGVIWNRRRREQPLHRAISAIIDPYRGRAPTHYGDGWDESIVSGALFTAAGKLEVPFEQDFDADGLVDRVASISFIGALPDAERARVLDRVRVLASDAGQPLRLGYTTEAYVYERR